MSFRSSTNPVEALPNRRIGRFGSKTWVLRNAFNRQWCNSRKFGHYSAVLPCCRELNASNGKKGEADYEPAESSG